MRKAYCAGLSAATATECFGPLIVHEKDVGTEPANCKRGHSKIQKGPPHLTGDGKGPVPAFVGSVPDNSKRLRMRVYAAITATKVRPVTGLNDLKSIRRVIGARNIVMFALSQIGFACLAALRAAQCFSPPFFHLEDVGMEPENFKSGHSQILLGH